LSLMWSAAIFLLIHVPSGCHPPVAAIKDRFRQVPGGPRWKLD
jgi:hypothetical protein